MCGRYNLKTGSHELAAVFAALRGDQFHWEPRYNIAPTQPVVVVRLREDRQRELSLLRWGLVPSWAKDPARAASMINARSETVDTKPAFRAAFKRRRCLLPATGFYEWCQAGRSRQPVLIRLQQTEPFAFAGLWETWTDPAGGELETCTILTTAANGLLAGLHDRMPVILAPDDYEDWLNCPEPELPSLHRLWTPYSAKQMELVDVESYVNNVRNEGPECERPVSRGLFD